MENKRVKFTKCGGKLQLVKIIKEVTGKSLLECKNIMDSIATPHQDKLTGHWEYTLGTLLLNESSITPEQWKEIMQHPDFIKSETEFIYV